LICRRSSHHCFLDARSIVRFGTPPFRIEIMTAIDGVEYDGCWRRHLVFDIDGVRVPVISDRVAT
jgi:hypothetical protein